MTLVILRGHVVEKQRYLNPVNKLQLTCVHAYIELGRRYWPSTYWNVFRIWWSKTGSPFTWVPVTHIYKLLKVFCVLAIMVITSSAWPAVLIMREHLRRSSRQRSNSLIKSSIEISKRCWGSIIPCRVTFVMFERWLNSLFNHRVIDLYQLDKRRQYKIPALDREIVK